MNNKFIITVLCFVCLGLTCKAELIKSVSELQPQSVTSEQVNQIPQNSENGISEQEGQPQQNAETAFSEQEQQAEEVKNPDEIQPSEELVEQAIKHKVPMGASKIIKKFLFAMACVAGCSLFLYLILIVFKRGKKKETIADRIITDYEHTLDTPQNINDAINIFLNKNKL